MLRPESSARIVLIGGSSHAGKSTLGHALAAKLGWDLCSTDRLARHPGFPWMGADGKARPQNVIEHYRTLSVEELMGDVLAHYSKNVIPQIGTMIHDTVSDATRRGLVIEGSALWPEFVVHWLRTQPMKAIWLTARDSLFRQRIHRSSNFSQASPATQFLTEKFLARTLLYNRLMQEQCAKLNLPCVHMEAAGITNQILERNW